MLLTITTTQKPATDLAVLLHKSGQRCQTTPLNFGKARVFYPVASESECTAALLLDIDPIEIIRTKGRSQESMPLEQYVNDRPYVASSFLSVAIAQTLGSALKGKCKNKPELVDKAMPLTVTLNVVQAKGGAAMIERLFKPLGYEVKATGYTLDEKFADWGESNLFTVELKNEVAVKDLLSHLYVLIPVLDNKKHYFVGNDELEKLLKHGEGWLAQHPDKELITSRYLKYLRSLADEALERLNEGEETDFEEVESKQGNEERFEEKHNLNQERHGTVLSVLKSFNAESVLDVGCAEGRFLNLLLKERQFKKIVGMDVAVRSLEIAAERLRMDRLPTLQKERINLIHGSLMYRDKRLSGFDAATVIEVIEHLESYRLAAFERVMFEYAAPKLVVVTTPNVEYNVMWESLTPGKFRHPDHRFEWTRQQFQEWAKRVAGQYNYDLRFLPVGAEDAKVGSPTQMGIFTKKI